MNRRAHLVAVALSAAVAACASNVRAADQGTVVELGNLKSRAPASWKEEPVSVRMRLVQFQLPKVDGDKKDAEVVIFHGITGSTQGNITRWKGFFIPPEGKTIDQVAKVTEMKLANAEATILDVHGTYKFKSQPFNPEAKEELLPDYRMMAVVFNVNDKPYHIRFVGPAKTVAHYKKGFDEWLKAFK